MTSQRYAETKDSGIEWLGRVPFGWEVLPLKACFEIIGGSTPKSDEDCFWSGDIAWATPADLSTLDSLSLDRTQRRITDEGLKSCGTTLVPAGSIVLSTRAPIGSLAIAAKPLCTNQGCKSLVPNERTNSKYFAYLLSVCTEALNVRGKGTTFLELSGDALRAFRVPVPSRMEQAGIASFLDAETAKIDALVAEQRRLIQLLQVKRQADISHAVTKGLNPDAPLKPSGISWLGDVPQYWTVGRFKRFWSVTDCKHVTAEFVSGEGIPLASIKEVQGRWVRLEEAKRTTQAFYEVLIEGDRAPIPGDLIFSRNATVGEVAQVSEKAPRFAMGQDVCLLRRNDSDSSPSYWQYLLKSRPLVEQLNLAMVGATFKRVNVDDIRNLWVVSPPAEEQRRIASLLDECAGRFDMLIGEAERAIAILGERRTALISAAVTGKIDVRGLVPQEAA